MIVVLGASAAIGILLNKGKDSEHKTKIEKADAVISPELFLSEIANVAWKYHKLAGFSAEQSLQIAIDGINLVDSYIPTEQIWKESLREALNYNHPVYDCLYMVCTRRNDGILMTTDRKLRQLCKKLKVSCL